MKLFRKILSIFLSAVIIMGLAPNLIQQVFAAPVAVNIFVDSYVAGSGKLTMKWFQSDIQAAAASANVTYHYIDSSGTPQSKTVTAADFAKTASKTTASITDSFANDVIYDLKVSIFDSSNNVVGKGMLYFIPKITFRSEIQAQEAEVASSAGGYEIGTKPVLKLKWNKPVVWNGTSFQNAEETLAFMQSQLNSFYGSSYDISTLDYLVSVESQASVQVNYESGQYKAKVENSDDSTKRAVETSNAGKSLDFYLLGRKDSSTMIPTTDGAIQSTLPSALRSVKDYVLPHGGILPGTVYNMSIKPIFKKTDGSNIYVVSVGDPTAQNDSTLYTQTPQTLVPYAYTPLRFKLTKDDLGNVYVDIFRLNQGSHTMPNLYYQVQVTNDYSLPGEWPEKARMNDQYFNGNIATTVISDIDQSNTMYYRIVVWSDNQADRLQSWYIPYKIVDDSSKPSAPKNITVIPKELKTVANGEKTTNIVITWEKPSNFDAIKSNLYFNFELNTSQNELLTAPYPTLQANGKAYGQFPLKYRLVRYVKATSNKITENNGYLSYTIDGDTLFKHDNNDGNGLVDGPAPDTNDGNTYPTFLLPNTTYFLRMYSTSGGDPLDPESESSKSIITGFTTLSGNDLDVPVPKNLKGTTNFDIVNNKISSYIIIQFDKINMSLGANDKIYYDLYMSSDAVNYTLIGSTDTMVNSNSDNRGNVVFTGTDLLSATIKATIKDFASGTKAYTSFGSKLLPNTTYYFTVKTRLKVVNMDERVSVSTAVLPITTLSGSIGDADDTGKRPLAPVDFAIAKDSNGNYLVSGSKVTFTWTRTEGSNYVIVASTSRLAADAELSSLSNDSIYQSFSNAFSQNGISINPDMSQTNLTYDPITNVCKYTIDKWLYPNRLYYFSIRAVTPSISAKTPNSVWISIPVTTSLIDAPTSLTAVNDSELGFNWVDTAQNVSADDFKIYIKGPSDADYKAMNRAQCTIIKDGTTYYGRIMNLKANTQYKVKVLRGTSVSMSETSLLTKDAYHEVVVSWTGLASYTYELAVKTSDDTDYTTLISSDYTIYTEKSSNTVGTSYVNYYATIKSVKVTLADGTSEYRQLKSNTKYFVKVRAIKIDSIAATYSKYVGPVDIRTEFNQKDYDTTDEETKNSASFLDKIEKLEEALYWRIDMASRTENKILLKGERVADALQNNSAYSFSIDISALGPKVNTDIIYIPADVIRAMNSENKNIVFKTLGAEFTIRPNTFDVDNMKEVKSLQGKQALKDIFFKLTITRNYNSKISVASKTVTVAQVNDFKVQAQASLKAYNEMKDLIRDRVYNTKTGLVAKKKNLLLDSGTTSANQDKLTAEIDQYVAEVESELSDYIGDMLKSNVATSNATEYVKAFGKPLMARLVYTASNGKKIPYANYDGVNKWQDVSTNAVFTPNMMTFNISKTGKYTVIAIVVSNKDIPDNSPYKPYISAFMAKFDLGSVFTGIDKSFNADSTVSTKEIILLYETVLGKTNDDSGMDMRQKARALKLDTVLNMNNLMKDVSRQEAAVVLIRLYSVKVGVNPDTVKPKSNAAIKDASQIDSKCYKSVLMTLDLKLLQLSQGYFKPKDNIGRGELVACFTKVLQLTGEL